MTNAPERIWVDFEPRDWPSERIMYGDMPDPYTSYIRADLMTELVGLLGRASEELRMLRAKDTGAVYDITLRLDLTAALAKIKETTK